MWWTTLAFAASPADLQGDPMAGWFLGPTPGQSSLVLVDEVALAELAAKPIDVVHGGRTFRQVEIRPSNLDLRQEAPLQVRYRSVEEVPCGPNEFDDDRVQLPVREAGALRFRLQGTCRDGAPPDLWLRPAGDAVEVEHCGEKWRARVAPTVESRYHALATTWADTWLKAEGLPRGASPGTLRSEGVDLPCFPLYDHGRSGPGAPEPLLLCRSWKPYREVVLGKSGARPDVIVHDACEVSGWMLPGE
jgi:hypothetical protein